VCEYIIVNEPALLSGVFGHIGGSAKLPPEKGGPRPDQAAKAYTIVLINKALEDKDSRRVTYYDVGLAAGNILLTATEQGIGGCPILMFNEEGLRGLLKIPDRYDIGLVIAMGYPDEAPVAEVAEGPVDIYVDDKGVRHVPKRKLEDIIHRNGF
jgi:nitroreductase